MGSDGGAIRTKLAREFVEFAGLLDDHFELLKPDIGRGEGRDDEIEGELVVLDHRLFEKYEWCREEGAGGGNYVERRGTDLAMKRDCREDPALYECIAKAGNGMLGAEDSES